MRHTFSLIVLILSFLLTGCGGGGGGGSSGATPLVPTPPDGVQFRGATFDPVTSRDLSANTFQISTGALPPLMGYRVNAGDTLNMTWATNTNGGVPSMRLTMAQTDKTITLDLAKDVTGVIYVLRHHRVTTAGGATFVSESNDPLTPTSPFVFLPASIQLNVYWAGGYGFTNQRVIATNVTSPRRRIPGCIQIVVGPLINDFQHFREIFWLLPGTGLVESGSDSSYVLDSNSLIGDFETGVAGAG